MQFVNSSKTLKIFTAYSEVLLPKKERKKEKKEKKKTQNKKNHCKSCLHSHHGIFAHACISGLSIAPEMVLYLWGFSKSFGITRRKAFKSSSNIPSQHTCFSISAILFQPKKGYIWCPNIKSILFSRHFPIDQCVMVFEKHVLTQFTSWHSATTLTSCHRHFTTQFYSHAQDN